MRKIKQIFKAKPTLEGAGVHLHRVFGYNDIPKLDPFLMLDDFRNDDPSKYLAGFPWHPHRGIETITYMLEGSAEHGDSIGNSGVIRRNEVQWMTAGSGIIHQEMPKPDDKGRMYGFQLWANLPASHKMIDPHYRGVTEEEIPQIETKDGVSVKVVAGSFDGVKGGVSDIVINPEFWDVNIPANCFFSFPTQEKHTCIIYAIAGAADFSGKSISNREGVLFDDGLSIGLRASSEGFRMLFLSGKPLREEISWRGPIVMNTKEEIDRAFQELHDGTFIKGKR